MIKNIEKFVSRHWLSITSAIIVCSIFQAILLTPLPIKERIYTAGFYILIFALTSVLFLPFIWLTTKINKEFHSGWSNTLNSLLFKLMFNLFFVAALIGGFFYYPHYITNGEYYLNILPPTAGLFCAYYFGYLRYNKSLNHD